MPLACEPSAGCVLLHGYGGRWGCADLCGAVCGAGASGAGVRRCARMHVHLGVSVHATESTCTWEHVSRLYLH